MVSIVISYCIIVSNTEQKVMKSIKDKRLLNILNNSLSSMKVFIYTESLTVRCCWPGPANMTRDHYNIVVRLDTRDLDHCVFIDRSAWEDEGVIHF